MIQLTIDGKTVNADDGATILDAAKSADIDIPAMCRCGKTVSPVSCFVCAVKVDGSDTFVPSCAAPICDGMTVDTRSDDVMDCRRRALELMLSDHAGDCDAPCSRICPSGLDIPEMMRGLVSGNINAAAETVRLSMPLPATLGHICPAPCEKGCRRTAVDTAVSIRETHKIIAEKIINSSLHNKKINTASNSKTIGVIGSGPAGLSAAHFLAVKGYSCTVFESQSTAGGTLRTQFDESVLPQMILDAEIRLIEDLGVKFVFNKKIDAVDEIYNDYDSVIIAAGLPDKNQRQFDLEYNDHGIKTCRDTSAASRPKVFACGSSTQSVRMAARAVGQGRSTAVSVDNYLSGKSSRKQFSMNTGRLSTEETESLINSIPYAGDNDSSSTTGALSDGASRCLQCDCGKKNSCVLRDMATEYGAHHLHYATGSRKPYIRKRYDGSGLIREPGKCTACGRCVSITREKRINPGLAFTGRGSNVQVSAPFDTPFDAAMGEALDECVKSCPTGALWIIT